MTEEHRRSKEYVVAGGGKVETQPVVKVNNGNSATYHLHRRMAYPLVRVNGPFLAPSKMVNGIGNGDLLDRQASCGGSGIDQRYT